MRSFTNLLIVIALVFLASCESSTGSAPVEEEVVQLPETAVVVTAGVSVTQEWSEITEFEARGDTLFIAGVRRITRDGEPMEAERSYDVCEIQSLTVTPLYLVPVLLDCENPW